MYIYIYSYIMLYTCLYRDFPFNRYLSILIKNTT